MPPHVLKARVTLSGIEAAVLRKLGESGFGGDTAIEIFRAIESAGGELRDRESGECCEISRSLDVERFALRGCAGGFATAVAIPGRGWVLWIDVEGQGPDRGCRHLEPVFIPGDGGQLVNPTQEPAHGPMS